MESLMLTKVCALILRSQISQVDNTKISETNNIDCDQNFHINNSKSRDLLLLVTLINVKNMYVQSSYNNSLQSISSDTKSHHPGTISLLRFTLTKIWVYPDFSKTACNTLLLMSITLTTTNVSVVML